MCVSSKFEHLKKSKKHLLSFDTEWVVRCRPICKKEKIKQFFEFYGSGHFAWEYYWIINIPYSLYFLKCIKKPKVCLKHPFSTSDDKYWFFLIVLMLLT